MSTATYGTLFEEATRYLEQGRHQLHLDRLEDKRHAEIAVSAYYGLCDAARQHIWALITPARMAGVMASTHPHPVEAAALTLAEALQVGPDDVPPHPQVVSGARHPWDYAGRSLRAASDLLATHVSITGGARTPDADVVWDPAARHAALGRLGGFVAQLTSTQDALALRAGQAGLRWERVGRWLPPTGHVRAVSLELVRAAELTGATLTDLDGLTPASTQVRGGRPADQLGELVARIRRTAWNLRAEPDYSVRTLTDVARAGFEVAVHTATFHGVDLHDPGAITLDRSARRAAAWLALMGDMRGYLGSGPGNAQIHTDVTSVHDLLGVLIPRDHSTGDRGACAAPEERHLGGTLHGACAALVQAAEWNAATFARLARSAQVYIPIESLTRDELSERPDLAATKLAHASPLVPAPTARTETTLDRYRDVAHAGTLHTQYPTAPTMPHSTGHDDAGPVLTREPAIGR